MSEDAQSHEVDPSEAQTPASTGHEQVDRVLASLEGLEDRPVSEHVTVFEQAHDRLRDALAAAGDTPGAPAG
ncbi:MAG: hypothetical protein WBQ50_13175 [Nocardioides sp.]